MEIFFSVATEFACQEFESWLIAGVASLSEKSLTDGRTGVKAHMRPPQEDLELAPRNAKRWLNGVMESGYNAAKDQLLLAEMVDLALIRNRPMRSFLRLESALFKIVEACRNESHVVSPS